VVGAAVDGTHDIYVAFKIDSAKDGAWLMNLISFKANAERLATVSPI
jgi:hypothetical protein